MLSIGLTGGIAAGKSLLANRFSELGALVIDADKIARDVVAPGTPGLAAVVRHFGESVLLPDGSLNRPKLGSLVFGDPSARDALNGIVHPLVRAQAQALKDDAEPGTIVVQDIPLLVETGQGPNFHLVVVVQAPTELRLQRMVRDRGMNEADALARIAAQATDEQREAVADVVIVNDGGPEQALAALDQLWHGRLLPFATNLSRGVPAPLEGIEVVDADATWPAQAARMAARLAAALGAAAAGIEHVGPTSVPGRPARDVLEFRVQLRAGENPEQPSLVLASSGFPRVPGTRDGAPVHGSADPGRLATVELHATA